MVETTHKPLLSDEEMNLLTWSTSLESSDNSHRKGGAIVRDFYEAKIASGELRVVVSASFKDGDMDCPQCSSCGYNDYEDLSQADVHSPPHHHVWRFCPHCGAKILP